MQNDDELIPSVLESDESSNERRKSWARLIRSIQIPSVLSHSSKNSPRAALEILPPSPAELSIFTSRETPTISCARVLLDIQVKTLLHSHLKKGVLISYTGNTLNPSVLLLGAGEMGKAIAHDLLTFVPDVKLSVFDSNPRALQRLQEFLTSSNIRVVPGDIQDLKLIGELISGSDVVIGAVSYKSNFDLSRLAVECKASWIDLGGNNDIVDQQFTLDKDAASAGVTIIPDCGLAPGMVNIIAGHAFRESDVTDEIHLRVGGLPQNPKPPLNYELCFSADGLINEYIEPTRILRDGRLEIQDSLCEVEHLDLGAPYDNLEAFYTSGGTSTLVKSLGGRVRNLDYKTIRYTGHLDKIKFLSDFGYFDSGELPVSEKPKISPRKITEALFHRLGWVKRDVVLLKAWALGQKQGKPTRIGYSLVDEYDEATGLTAMARTTGFSAAIIAEMIIDGRIREKGVLYQELSVPHEEYFTELRKRGIDIRIS